MIAARPSLVLIPQYFGALVFDRRTSRYAPFDGDAARVLEALRVHGVDAVLRDHCRALAASVDECSVDDMKADVRALASHLHERGWLTLDGKLAAARIHREPPADHLLGPLAVHLEIIGACNLACTHCFAGELPRNHDPLTVLEMDRLFGEMAGVGALRLGLTGGEPLMRKDLLDILDAATEHGLHPCITSNALLIDDRIARELGKRDLVWLNISLEGATAASNDAIRGAGVFDGVRKKLELLREHARFTLAFTITSHNANEVEA
ncbi:MAG TPA: radical SAM protein, partial [Myxococcota bacterium]